MHRLSIECGCWRSPDILELGRLFLGRHFVYSMQAPVGAAEVACGESRCALPFAHK